MRILLLLLVLRGFQVFTKRSPSVTGLTGTLTTEERSALNQQLQTLEQQSHFQVAVLVTPATGGKSIKLAASQGCEVYHWKPVGEKRYDEGVLILVIWPEGLALMKIGHGLEQMLPPKQVAQIVRCHIQPEFEKNNLFAGLTDGIKGTAQFTHIKVNLSPLDTLVNHLFVNPQLSLPCPAWTMPMIVAIIVLWWFTSCPGPGIWMMSTIIPTVRPLRSQDDIITQRTSVVCFSLFLTAIYRRRLAVVLNMCRVSPMMLAPKNKNAKVKKQKKTPQFRESGRNSLSVVVLIIIVGWHLVFASNKDIASTSTVIGLVDHFIGPITITGIALLIIVAESIGNLKLGSGEESNRKTGNRNAHIHSCSSLRGSFHGGGGSSRDGDSSGR